MAAEIVKLADYLEIDTFDILGRSYGGLIAQVLAFLQPDRVRRAVLVGTNPIGKNDVPFEPFFGQHAMKQGYDPHDYTVLFFEPASAASGAAAKASMDRTWPKVDQSRVPSTMALFQRYMAGMKAVAHDSAGLRSHYGTTKTPMLVISGGHDISSALENWHPLMRKAPTLQLLALPQSGHGVHFQYPLLCASYVRDFLGVHEQPLAD